MDVDDPKRASAMPRALMPPWRAATQRSTATPRCAASPGSDSPTRGRRAAIRWVPARHGARLAGLRRHGVAGRGRVGRWAGRARAQGSPTGFMVLEMRAPPTAHAIAHTLCIVPLRRRSCVTRVLHAANVPRTCRSSAVQAPLVHRSGAGRLHSVGAPSAARMRRLCAPLRCRPGAARTHAGTSQTGRVPKQNDDEYSQRALRQDTLQSRSD